MVERNFIGCGVGKNLTSDFGREEGKRYLVAGGEHYSVGACAAPIIELHRARADSFDVWPQDDAAARDVVHKRRGNCGLALRDAHLRIEAPGSAGTSGAGERAAAAHAPFEGAAALQADHELEQGRSERQGQRQRKAGDVVVSGGAEEVIGDNPSAAAGRCEARACVWKGGGGRERRE